MLDMQAAERAHVAPQLERVVLAAILVTVFVCLILIASGLMKLGLSIL